MAKSKNISTSQLALMTAAAVISLRGLPMMAQEELTMFFYIFFATFLFLIPAALVGACLVLAADLLGQFAFDTKFPVGVITGILGAPYLLYLLIRTSRRGGSS